MCDLSAFSSLRRDKRDASGTPPPRAQRAVPAFPAGRPGQVRSAMRTLFIPERVTRFTHDALPHPIELEQKPDADVPHEADGTVQADGTCSRLWPTSLVLTRYLCAHPELVAGKRVVELGAGAGGVGLACAALGAEHVVSQALQP